MRTQNEALILAMQNKGKSFTYDAGEGWIGHVYYCLMQKRIVQGLTN